MTGSKQDEGPIPVSDRPPQKNDLPTMHCHSDLLRDLGHREFLPDSILLKWFEDGYSTSKHLLTLYSMAVGLKARTIVEIGCGRSTFVLARAAFANEGRMFCCDTKDYRHLLSPRERHIIRYYHGTSDKVWNEPKLRQLGIDFAFLDYFSGDALPLDFVVRETVTCLGLLKQNGVVCIHDSHDERYQVRNLAQALPADIRCEQVTLPYNYGLMIIRRLSPSARGQLGGGWLKKADR